MAGPRWSATKCDDSVAFQSCFITNQSYSKNMIDWFSSRNQSGFGLDFEIDLQHIFQTLERVACRAAVLMQLSRLPSCMMRIGQMEKHVNTRIHHDSHHDSQTASTASIIAFSIRGVEACKTLSPTALFFGWSLCVSVSSFSFVNCS